MVLPKTSIKKKIAKFHFTFKTASSEEAQWHEGNRDNFSIPNFYAN